MVAIYPDLTGKVAVVTGAGSGIGEAIVRRLAEQGVSVGFIDLKQAESLRLAEELTAAGRMVRFEPADLTDVPALRDAIGRIRGAFGRSASSSTTQRTTSAMRRRRSRRSIGTPGSRSTSSTSSSPPRRSCPT